MWVCVPKFRLFNNVYVFEVLPFHDKPLFSRVNYMREGGRLGGEVIYFFHSIITYLTVTWYQALHGRHISLYLFVKKQCKS